MEENENETLGCALAMNGSHTDHMSESTIPVTGAHAAAGLPFCFPIRDILGRDVVVVVY